MKGTNLYKDTIRVLRKNGKGPKDVLWVGTEEWSVTWADFEMMSRLVMIPDDPYGGPFANHRLKIVGKDFVMDRREYDGTEWWEFISLVQPAKAKVVSVSMFQP